MKTYQEAVEFLANLGSFGLKPGLANIRRLSESLGNPHEQLRFIHVAGTNGKGSVCAFLESVYRHAGLKVGLYTSPHLVSFTERIQINRGNISEAAVVQLVEKLRPLLATFSQEEHPTFFEAVTAMALRHFANEHCDLVIWETGLGGRFDATNLVTPVLSVITNIGFDHMQWLGDTLEKIATEKAGIIKPGVPVVSGTIQPEATRVIANVARGQNASQQRVIPGDAFHQRAKVLPLQLAGVHQQTNAAVALAAVATLQSQISVAPEAIERGMSSAKWPGRFQVEKLADGRALILDGAHNADGAAALVETLKKRFPDTRPALVIGLLADKDVHGIVKRFAREFGQVFTVPVPSSRSLDPAALMQLFREANPDVPISACGSLAEALKKTAAEKVIVCTGSLFLIGQAISELGLNPDAGSSEMRLNDWSASPLKRGVTP